MKDVSIFYGHSVNFTVIWFILWPLDIFVGFSGIYFHVLVSCSKRNLATLLLYTCCCQPLKHPESLPFLLMSGMLSSEDTDNRDVAEEKANKGEKTSCIVRFKVARFF
jgi:hypothetical protein